MLRRARSHRLWNVIALILLLAGILGFLFSTSSQHTDSAPLSRTAKL